ncbi:hypothetical protein BDW75DRAFT_218027 [Aspergillus navahoensis]
MCGPQLSLKIQSSLRRPEVSSMLANKPSEKTAFDPHLPSTSPARSSHQQPPIVLLTPSQLNARRIFAL